MGALFVFLCPHWTSITIFDCKKRKNPTDAYVIYSKKILAYSAAVAPYVYIIILNIIYIYIIYIYILYIYIYILYIYYIYIYIYIYI